MVTLEKATKSNDAVAFVVTSAVPPSHSSSNRHVCDTFTAEDGSAQARRK
jgi:hypothetical protein